MNFNDYMVKKIVSGSKFYVLIQPLTAVFMVVVLQR